jgi:hypothetical protein
MPARRCSTSAGSFALVVPLPTVAAMLAAPTRSRCQQKVQDGQRNRRPDGLGVSDHQHPDPVLDGEGDDLLGGLVMGLADSETMTVLDPALFGAMVSPAARAALPRPGCPVGCFSLAGLLVA